MKIGTWFRGRRRRAEEKNQRVVQLVEQIRERNADALRQQDEKDAENDYYVEATAHPETILHWGYDDGAGGGRGTS